MAPTEFEEKPKNADRSARRREKSRDAARCRRQQESDTFNEICNVIPVPSKMLAQMDRSMIMRLMISFMKFRNLLNAENASHLKVGIDGPEFVWIYTRRGSLGNHKLHEGINSLTQAYIKMPDIVHDLGTAEIIVKLLVLKCEGIVHQSQDGNPRYMVAYCEPIPHPANIEMVLDCNTFLSQHSLNMHFTYCDEDSEDDMIGQSFFDFCHTEDIKLLEESFKTLYRLGQITTSRYRMLVKSGGYVWVVSQATVINNPRNQQPSNIVCVHYIISGVTEENCILSSAQLKYVEENESMPKLEEITDDQLGVVACGDEIFDSTICDSTSSIFIGSNKSTEDAYDSTSSAFRSTPEELEVMAKNAPSIGDEIEFKDFNFDDCILVDEEMCRNAPSIGDPMWDCTFLPEKDSKQLAECDTTSQMEQLFRGIMPNENYPAPIKIGAKLGENQRYTPSPPHLVSVVEDTGTVAATRMKRKLPRDSQIITIPKTLYQRHVQPALAISDKCGSYKYDPPENAKMSSFSNPPTKRQKRQFNGDLGYGKGWDCGEKNRYQNEDEFSTPLPGCKRENRSWLPVLSLHDCEINAPVEDGVSALEWMTLSDVLGEA